MELYKCFSFLPSGLVWILFLLPSLKADTRRTPTNFNLPLSPHPKQSLENLSLQSSSSILHKIIRKHDFHAQPVSSNGASNLHQIIQKLRHFAKNHQNFNNNNKSNSYRTFNISDKTGSHPLTSSSMNNGRLKRQLEGIFHVRGTPTTSTVIPILSSSTNKPNKSNPSLTLLVPNGNNGYNNANKTKTTKKENRHTEDRNNSTTTSTTKNSNFIDTDILPPELKDKRNFTVEIVEISRKTIIKQDKSGDDDNNNDNNNPPPPQPPTEFDNTKKVIDSKASLQTENFLKPTPFSFKSVRPRLTFKRFRQPSQLKILDDSKTSANNNLRFQNKTREVTTTTPIPKPIREKKQNPINPVEIKVNYQDQIPYNDRDVDEADLKDYLDGHSTFGAKGDFKHTISRNVSGFLPNNPPKDSFKRGHPPSTKNHEVHKRTPQPPTQRRVRSRPGHSVKIEQANVKQMVNHPKAIIYTASGVTQNPVSQEGDSGKSVFEYSGNRNRKTPKPTSAFEELYRQGHPAVAKPPKPMYKRHPLAEPYGTAQTYAIDNDENPFRADPLRDEPPLKFDPESDRFYGNPTPEKDKRLAQSNRPEPVLIENQTPEYQERDDQRDRTSTTTRASRDDNNNNNEDDNDRYFYQRAYEPKDQDYYGTNNNENSPSVDPFIRDFVSLDDNFERLPKPSEDDENFRSLVPSEADDDEHSRYFEPDQDDYDDDKSREKQTQKPERDEQTTTNRRDNDDNEREDNRRPSKARSRHSSSNDDYDDGYDESADHPDDFDPSYVDALKQFDREIERIEENERRGVTTGNPPLEVTREPPLVITSPGPAVDYPTGRSAQRPTLGTTPIHRPQEENEDEEQEDEQTEQPDNRDREVTTDKSRGNNNNNEEEEEEEEEPSEESEDSSTEKSDKDNDTDKTTEKDADESQKEHVGIKINKVHRETSSIKPKDDKSGNLDEDITEIEKEFSRSGVI